jgi:hypothetical protein
MAKKSSEEVVNLRIMTNLSATVLRGIGKIMTSSIVENKTEVNR